MAKTDNNVGDSGVLDSETNPPAPVRTPENTPLPGGGSWKWDDTTANWVAV